jgi:hypothetical protein
MDWVSDDRKVIRGRTRTRRERGRDGETTTRSTTSTVPARLTALPPATATRTYRGRTGGRDRILHAPLRHYHSLAFRVEFLLFLFLITVFNITEYIR